MKYIQTGSIWSVQTPKSSICEASDLARYRDAKKLNGFSTKDGNHMLSIVRKDFHNKIIYTINKKFISVVLSTVSRLHTCNY